MVGNCRRAFCADRADEIPTDDYRRRTGFQHAGPHNGSVGQAPDLHHFPAELANEDLSPSHARGQIWAE